ILVTAHRSGSPEERLAAAVALNPRLRGKASYNEAATMVHAGPLISLDQSHSAQAASQMADQLDRCLAERGVQFVQWATDPNPGVTSWCRSLGYLPIAELEYLSGKIPATETTLATETNRSLESSFEELFLEALVWDKGESCPEDFTELVEQTYQGTLDCPALANFRTAEQTLDGYQQAAVFDPRLWFRVIDRHGASTRPIGCVILASHNPPTTSGGVVELVYMGLVSEVRGEGRGRLVLRRAIEVALKQGAERMVMAVDQANQPARKIYLDSGFRPILRESVWGKSIQKAAAGR
ncbi:MAG: GNAT family N-acetyltransferase, partial [Pirellulales bacterium]|nr:GNAT family N-acetyltransferase [Pirellulales bacterium]